MVSAVLGVSAVLSVSAVHSVRVMAALYFEVGRDIGFMVRSVCRVSTCLLTSLGCFYLSGFLRWSLFSVNGFKMVFISFVSFPSVSYLSRSSNADSLTKIPSPMS